MPVRNPSERKEHDAERLGEGLDELVDRMADHDRVVGELVERKAHRQVRSDLGHLCIKRLAEGDEIAVLDHGDADADRGAAVLANQARGRGG
jgi:hypothetical protein